jgi:neutral trehalase
VTILRKFVERNFSTPGDDLERIDDMLTPLLSSPEGSLLRGVVDIQLKEWASDLCKMWPELARNVKDRIVQYPQRHSLLPRLHPFTVPGGRFRETCAFQPYPHLNLRHNLMAHPPTSRLLGFVFYCSWSFINWENRSGHRSCWKLD